MLNTPQLKLEIPHDKKSILVLMHGNRLPLESYGSGIYQLILLCAALVIYEDRWICIEEPETHFHPELQRKFLDFLVNDTNNRYFITTHSNTFINYSKKVSIYHLEHDSISSSIVKVENSLASYSILNDLGYKASDLLQANGVIWVEGPSDRNYILKWISLIDNSLEEGLHYSIMFYGGKNLANVSFDITKEKENGIERNLIPLLRINKNAFVVIDSDIFKNKTQINSTKQRIQKEIGSNNCWITKGKEIENYLNPRIIEQWLTSKSSYNKTLITQGDSVQFSELIVSLDKTGKIKYDLNKSAYSKEISKVFIKEDLEFNYLKDSMNSIINAVRTWNHYELNTL